MYEVYRLPPHRYQPEHHLMLIVAHDREWLKQTAWASIYNRHPTMQWIGKTVLQEWKHNHTPLA